MGTKSETDVTTASPTREAEAEMVTTGSETALMTTAPPTTPFQAERVCVCQFTSAKEEDCEKRVHRLLIHLENAYDRVKASSLS